MDDSAIRAIVDTYVRYGNRRAVEDLRAHRGRLLASLIRTLGGPYDFRNLIAQTENEIAVIEAGLAKLKPAAREQGRGALIGPAPFSFPQFRRRWRLV